MSVLVWKSAPVKSSKMQNWDARRDFIGHYPSLSLGPVRYFHFIGPFLWSFHFCLLGCMSLFFFCLRSENRLIEREKVHVPKRDEETFHPRDVLKSKREESRVRAWQRESSYIEAWGERRVREPEGRKREHTTPPVCGLILLLFIYSYYYSLLFIIHILCLYKTMFYREVHLWWRKRLFIILLLCLCSMFLRFMSV